MPEERSASSKPAGDETNPNIDHLNNLGLIWHSQQDWDYYTPPQPAAMNRRIHLPRGKVLGGSNALNAVIWVRGDAWDYEQWVESGCPGWSWDEVWPVFAAIENYDGEITENRGTDGPMDVRVDYARNPLQEDMFSAATQTGVPANDDYNSGSVEGIGKIQLNVRDGKRLNTWRAYLKPRLGEKNLTILTSAHARRLLLDGTTVTGLEIDFPRPRRHSTRKRSRPLRRCPGLSRAAPALGDRSRRRTRRSRHRLGP